MTEQQASKADKALLQRILKDTDSIQTAEHIAEVWGSRGKTIGGIVQDHMTEIKGAMGLTYYEDDGACWWKQTGDIQVCLWLGDEIELGYDKETGKFNATTRGNLAEKLNELLPESLFEDKDPDNEKEVYRTFNCRKPLDQIAGYLVDCLKALEKAAKEAQEEEKARKEAAKKALKKPTKTKKA